MGSGLVSGSATEALGGGVVCVAEVITTRLRERRERDASILAGGVEEERATCKGQFRAAVQATGDHALVVSPPSAAVHVHTAFMPLSRSLSQQRPLLILWRSVIVHTTGLSSPSAAPASSSPSLPPSRAPSLTIVDPCTHSLIIEFVETLSLCMKAHPHTHTHTDEKTISQPVTWMHSQLASFEEYVRVCVCV